MVNTHQIPPSELKYKFVIEVQVEVESEKDYKKTLAALTKKAAIVFEHFHFNTFLSTPTHRVSKAKIIQIRRTIGE